MTDITDIFKMSMQGSAVPPPSSLPTLPISLKQVKKDMRVLKSYGQRIKDIVNFMDSIGSWMDKKRFNTIHHFDSQILDGLHAAQFSDHPSTVMLVETQRMLRAALRRAILGSDEQKALLDNYQVYMDSGSDTYDDSFVQLQSYLDVLGPAVINHEGMFMELDAVTDDTLSIMDWFEQVTDTRPSSLYGGLKIVLSEHFIPVATKGSIAPRDALIDLLDVPTLDSIRTVYTKTCGEYTHLLSSRSDISDGFEWDANVINGTEIVMMVSLLSIHLPALFEVYSRWDQAKAHFATYM